MAAADVTDISITCSGWSGTKQLGATGASATRGKGIAIDSHYNVFVAGVVSGVSGLDGNTLTGAGDLFLTRYDLLGNKVGTKEMGVASKSTGAVGVAVDSADSVYVAGTTDGNLDTQTLSGNRDAFLTKYDSSGTKIRTLLTGTAGAYTDASGVCADSANNIYVAGNIMGGALVGSAPTGTPHDLFVVKYDSDGVLQWTEQLGAASSDTLASMVSADSGSYVYVVGRTNGNLDGNTLKGTKDALPGSV